MKSSDFYLIHKSDDPLTDNFNTVFRVANEIALPPGLLTLTANRSGLFTLEQLSKFQENEVMKLLMINDHTNDEKIIDN